MFIFALILWIIDLVNVVAETRITLVDHPELSMDIKYQTATEFIFRRSAVQLALFSYMVRTSCADPRTRQSLIIVS